MAEIPSFHVLCSNQDCNSYCSKCLTLLWDHNKVLKSPTTTLEVSCCDGVCLVYVTIKDTYNGNYQTIPGAEIFSVTGDSHSRDFDSLTMTKIRNASACFSNLSSSATNTSSTETSITANGSELQINPTTSPLPKITFNDNSIKTVIQDVVNNNTNYKLDFRFNDALNLKINYNGKSQMLNQLIYNNLFTSDLNSNLICENAQCTLQINDGTQSNFNLNPNSVILPKLLHHKQVLVPL